MTNPGNESTKWMTKTKDQYSPSILSWGDFKLMTGKVFNKARDHETKEDAWTISPKPVHKHKSADASLSLYFSFFFHTGRQITG